MSPASANKPPTGHRRGCSIIIPVYNRKGLTRQCVEILLAEPPTATDHEIIVVDDASTDGTPELLAGYGNAIRIVRHEENIGFATSCNDGAAVAQGEYLVFLNNDTLPLKGWLDALVRYADRVPAAAVVGSKMLFPDDTIQHAGVVITEDRDPRHIYAGFPADHPAVNKSRRFPIVTAGCALFRRKPFEEAEGFDDAFVNGFEDVDLCLRLGELGYEVHYCHEAVLYHLEMGTRGLRDHRRNHLLYRRRWAHKVHPDAISRYIEDDLLKMTYSDRFPFLLEVSPLLALVTGDGPEREANRLLSEQARHVVDLSRENVLLRLELAGAGVAPPVITRKTETQQRGQELKAIYFLSDTPGDAMRYRCDHHAEELGLLGATSRVDRLDMGDLGMEGLASTATFVLHRVPLSEGVEWFFHAAREQNKVVIFDTDDLVFESQAAGSMLDLITMPDIDRQVLGERQELLSKTMAMCDAVLVTTEPLAAIARELNPRVYVMPNAANKEMVTLADEALAAKVEASGSPRNVTIAYFSGTLTHDNDFLQAAEAVLWALEDDSACRLLIVGNLALDSRFDRLRDRITSIPIQPWQRLPRILADVDINLAPLEPDNAFTESKSCLKYIEAGLVGVPTIASPRADFVRAIEPGRNGLLAEKPEEWQQAIGRLLDSSELRAQLGRGAHEDVRERHTTLALASQLFETVASIAKGRNARTLVVHCVVGTASLNDKRTSLLIRLVTHLRSSGHTVRVFSNGDITSRAAVQLAKELQVEALPDAAEAHLADVSIAFDPSSALMLAKRSDALFRLYLVDESEDDGDRLSDHELSSLLELQIRPVCLGEDLASRLSGLRGMRVDCLSLPLEPARFEDMLLEACFGRAKTLNVAASSLPST